MRRYPHLAARLFGTPIAIDPRKLQAILAALSDRFGFDAEDPELAGRRALAIEGRDRLPRKPQSGVATIDVFGALVHRKGAMDAMSGLTSYAELSDELSAAVDDPAVKAIVLRIDSPGGEVAGMHDFASEVHAARAKKRVVAFADGMACSAAYLIASAADEFVATESSNVGSIGIVYAHLDQSAADEKAGVKVTHIYAGANKVAGSPHKPLDAESHAYLQERVTASYELMTSRIAEYRGLKKEAVQSTEAGVFLGDKAKALGLVDGISTYREVVAACVTGRSLEQQPSLPFATASVPAWSGAISTNGGGGGGGGSVSVQHITITGHLDQQAREDLLGAIHSNKEKSMKPEFVPKAEHEVAVADLAAKLTAATAEVETLKTALAAFQTNVAELQHQRKLDVIEKHQRAGRIAPAMLGMVKRSAEGLTPEQLDEELAKLPSATHPVPSGEVAPIAPAAEGTPLEQLNAKADAIRKGNPQINGVDAFSRACFENPDLYKAHRAANTPTRAAKR